ncbi:MAG: T9SS type A sorting domain-containing protein [Bacteroidetes bacterium]|nr:T9SS type A sorting domain-containing protein [Bacteroidota bacterium]
MNSNKQRTNIDQGRLKAYSATAATVVAIASSADAALIITDVNPDIVIDSQIGELYMVDINNDSIPDISLYGYTNTTAWSYSPVNYIGGNAYANSFVVQASSYSGINYLVPMNNGATLSSGPNLIAGANFNTGSAGIIYWYDYWAFPSPSYTYGVVPWCTLNYAGIKNRYIGVKFDISGQTHYGWVFVDIGKNPNRTITIKSYGYESTPNTPMIISAKDRSGEMAGRTEVYSFGKNIHVNNAGNGAIVEVFSIAGKSVYRGALNGRSNRISLRGDGMHLVKITDKGTTTSKKVYLN